MQLRTNFWSTGYGRLRRSLLLAGLSAGLGGWTPPAQLAPVARRPAAYIRANPTSPTWELRHGHWFDGHRFRDQTLFVQNGLFQRQRPAHVDSVVDLAGGWVVPPFAEAHTHMLDGTYGLAPLLQRYLQQGVYYVQVLTNSHSGAVAAKPFLNQPRSVDAMYANGGLTSTLGHPFMAYEPRAMGLYDYTQWAANKDRIAKSRVAEHDSYWFLDSLGAVADQWPRILASQPDLIKIYLLHADRYEALHRDGQLGNKGLRPDVAADLVRRAHQAGLRVWAHIETVADFRLGLRLGVDGFAHAANYSGSACPDSAACYLTDADLRAAGQHGIAMTPTIWIGQGYVPPTDTARLRALRGAQRHLLQAMLRAGVPPLVGSDRYGELPLGEVLAWERLGAFDPPTLLRLWSETTAQAIFPGRRIGRLAPGYEASLLVLGQNPLRNFPAAVQDIRWRLKQGEAVGGAASVRRATPVAAPVGALPSVSPCLRVCLLPPPTGNCPYPASLPAAWPGWVGATSSSPSATPARLPTLPTPTSPTPGRSTWARWSGWTIRSKPCGRCPSGGSFFAVPCGSYPGPCGCGHTCSPARSG